MCFLSAKNFKTNHIFSPISSRLWINKNVASFRHFETKVFNAVRKFLNLYFVAVFGNLTLLMILIIAIIFVILLSLAVAKYAHFRWRVNQFGGPPVDSFFLGHLKLFLKTSSMSIEEYSPSMSPKNEAIWL